MTDRLAARLDELVGRLVRPRGPRSAVLRVEVPDAGFVHAAAAGAARADSDRAARPDDRFHVASVGKTFTAALVSRAAGEGAFGPLGLDAPLGALEAVPKELVAAVHPAGPSITVRQLLTHTSGMKDAVVDDADGVAGPGGPAPRSLVARFAADVAAVRRGEPGDGFARHRWVPWDPARPHDPMAGTLNRFIADGIAAAPVGAPGDGFHYSDTAYVLLGVVLQHVTGRTYQDLQRTQVIEPLALDGTYLAYVDDPSPTARAEEMDVWFGPAPLLSGGFDLSFDWAGGGQVSTAADLCRLLRAVLGGELAPGATERLDGAWFVPDGLTAPRRAVGLGLFRWQAGRHEVVGHAGAWGVRVFHHPGLGAWLAGTVNQQDDGRWMSDAFDLVEEELS